MRTNKKKGDTYRFSRSGACPRIKAPPAVGRGGASGIVVVRCGDTFAATNPLFKTGLVTLSINPAHTPGLKAGESNGFILHVVMGLLRSVMA